MKRYWQVTAASMLASTALLGAFGTSASAAGFDFTPQQTGEINVGLGCLDTCIDPGAIFESIVSLTDSSTGTQSRLFVDYFGAGDTENSYGNGTVKFKTKDVGTTPEGFWFRPSERQPDGSNEETGQLEVGTYLINFAQEIAEMTFYFFDTESKGTTGITAINGQKLDNPNYVSKGPDSNIVAQTFTNVKSFEVKLGNDTPSGTGDGVDFRISGIPAQVTVDPESVPEPASLLGLLAIAGAGLGLKRKGMQQA